MNKIQLSGELGENPRIKMFENGGKAANFLLSTKEEYTNRSGQKSVNINRHWITAKGKMAERVESQLTKGSHVTIEGKLVYRNYVDKTGQKKRLTEILALDVVLNH